MLSRLLPLLLVGFATAAQAQTIALTIDGRSDIALGPSDCSSGSFIVTWANTALASTCSGDLELWVTTGSCDIKPGTGDVKFDNIASTTFRTTASGQSSSMRFADLPLFVGGDAGSCGSAEIAQKMTVCGAFLQQRPVTLACEKTSASSSPTLSYDAEPPVAPVIDGVSGLSNALRVSFSPKDEDTRTFQILYAPSGSSADTFVLSSTVTRGTTQATVANLENDKEYEVRVYSKDDAQNRSKTYAAARGTPVAALALGDLCGELKNCGNAGCESTSGPVMVLAVLLLSVLVRGARRKRS
ncbi:MAG: MXAN_2561 family MXYO-CTERM-anchored protein [Myxococcaceae bacterium]